MGRALDALLYIIKGLKDSYLSKTCNRRSRESQCLVDDRDCRLFPRNFWHSIIIGIPRREKSNTLMWRHRRAERCRWWAVSEANDPWTLLRPCSHACIAEGLVLRCARVMRYRCLDFPPLSPLKDSFKGYPIKANTSSPYAEPFFKMYTKANNYLTGKVLWRSTS